MEAQTIERRTIVMVVDDDVDVLQTIKKYLVSNGFNVHAFSDGQSAYEHFRYFPKECSLILTDIRMPGMSGFELARKANLVNPDVKIVLMTGFLIQMTEMAKVLPSIKVDGIIVKPITSTKLNELMQKHLFITQ